MLYENYQRKILRISAILARLLRLLPLIIAIVAVIIVTVSGLLAAKGSISDFESPSELLYGEPLECDASAFLSKVYFEYREEGSDSWIEGKPLRPGRYFLRACASAAFGGTRYTEEHALVIRPRLLDVSIVEDSIPYGDTPTVRAELAPGDRITAVDFVYRDLFGADSAVRADGDRITIINESGVDVTGCYIIRTPEKSFTLTKRTVYLNVKGATKHYDGEPLRSDSYYVVNSLAKGDTISVEFDASIVTPGSVPNTPSSVAIFSEDGDDRTEYYDIIMRPIGALTVKPRPITVTTGSISTLYDGKEHSCPEYAISDSTPLVEGHTVEISFEGISCLFGDIGNTPTFFAIRDEKGTDVTERYDVTWECGAIVVGPRPLNITTGSTTVVFDGEEHKCLEYTISPDTPLAEGHRIEIISAVYGMYAGYYRNSLGFDVVDDNGGWHTGYYVINQTVGGITITPRPIQVTTGSLSWTYDGETHSCEEYTIDGLLEGHVAEVSFLLAYVGERDNRFDSFEIYNADGKRVTSSYQVIARWGILKAIPIPITVKIGPITWVYDGEYHPWSYTAELVSGELIPGDVLKEIYNTSQYLKDVGSYDIGKLLPEIRKENGYAVTAGYDITYIRNESMVIQPRTVVIETASQVWTYDGEAHRNGLYTIVSELGMTRREKLVLNNAVVITEVGSVKNELEFSIVDTDGEDASHNYNLIIRAGTLVIEPRTSGDDGSADDAPVFVPGKPADLTERYGFEDDDTVIARVKSDYTGTVYLRQESFGNYTENTWTVATPYSKKLFDEYNYNYLTTLALKNAGAEQRMLEIYDAKSYLLPYYPALYGDYGFYDSDTVYSSVRERYTVPFYAISDFVADQSKIRDNMEEYSTLMTEYRDFVRSNYLDVDSDVKAYIEENYKVFEPYEWKIGNNVYYGINSSAFSNIRNVIIYLDSLVEFDPNYDRALDSEENIVIAFLDKYKRGDSRHLASAATLIFRTLGIPARYVQGYVVDTVAGETVEVTASAHAWVEVYVNGVGWVHVDVTGKNESLAKQLIVIKPEDIIRPYTGEVIYSNGRVVPNDVLADLLAKGYTYSAYILGGQGEIGSSPSSIQDFTLYDPQGVNVTNNYDIIRNPGRLELVENTAEPLVVELFELQKYYDGKPLEYGKDDYVVRGLPEGYRIDLRLYITLTNVGEISLGEINGGLSRFVSYEIYDQSGIDVTSQYTVSFAKYGGDTNGEYVPIRIDPRLLEITTESATKVYDGLPLKNPGSTITRGSVVEGQRIVIEGGKDVTEIGVYENPTGVVKIFNDAGDNLIGNYKIVVKKGKLTVLDPKDLPSQEQTPEQ